jgi:hypothetical protein
MHAATSSRRNIRRSSAMALLVGVASFLVAILSIRVYSADDNFAHQDSDERASVSVRRYAAEASRRREVTQRVRRAYPAQLWMLAKSLIFIGFF